MRLRPIEVFNSKIPRVLRVVAITLYPFIFYRYSKEISERTGIIAHEMTHISQIQKLGVLRFYSQYLLQFFKNLLRLKSWDKAYLAISFEQEAFQKQDEFLKGIYG